MLIALSIRLMLAITDGTGYFGTGAAVRRSRPDLTVGAGKWIGIEAA